MDIFLWKLIIYRLFLSTRYNVNIYIYTVYTYLLVHLYIIDLIADGFLRVSKGYETAEPFENPFLKGVQYTLGGEVTSRMTQLRGS